MCRERKVEETERQKSLRNVPGKERLRKQKGARKAGEMFRERKVEGTERARKA
jgi:hypothetical protein